MKKIILSIFALSIFVSPLRAAQEVELTSPQWEDIIAMYEDLYGNSYNSQNYLLLLNAFFQQFSTNLTQHLTNNYEAILTELSSVNGSIYEFMSNHPEFQEFFDNFNILMTDFYPSVNENLNYLSSWYSSIQPRIFQTTPFQVQQALQHGYFNFYHYSNLYSNLLAGVIQSYTNKIEHYYSDLKNRYPFIRPWNSGGLSIFDKTPFDSEDIEKIATFNLPWYQVANDYLSWGANPSFDYYQSFMQYLNTLPGYSAFENMTGKRTIGGLIGSWDPNQNTIIVDPDKEAAAKDLFSPETWANDSFENIMRRFHFHFDNHNPTYIGDTNIIDLLTINEAIANAVLAGTLKPMAENVKKIADNAGGNSFVSNALKEVNVGISNVITSISALNGFTFPESIVSNLHEMVERTDNYETGWRTFYSPSSYQQIHYTVQNIEAQYDPIIESAANLSNHVSRFAATLQPENGLDRFLSKVRSYYSRNRVSQLPGEVHVMDFENLNAWFAEHFDHRIAFPTNLGSIDLSLEIHPGVTLGMFCEGVRDVFLIFHSLVGLYFGFKLTFFFLLIMRGTVMYLGIYLNIKALQVK